MLDSCGLSATDAPAAMERSDIAVRCSALLCGIIELLCGSRQGGQAKLFEKHIVFIPCFLSVFLQRD